jgi:hypothetical protein
MVHRRLSPEIAARHGPAVRLTQAWEGDMTNIFARRSIVALGCAAVIALGGCAAGDGRSSQPPAVSAVVSASPADVASPAASPVILEDAGLETPLAPGLYTSRLFKPTVRLELGDGWLRRDADDSRRLDIRHGQDGRDDITFVSGIDYLQCGKAAVISKPDSNDILEALATSSLLKVTEPLDVKVGDRTAAMVRLTGGNPIPDADLMRSNEFGCVMTVGAKAFPAEGFWILATTAATMQLVILDVDGTTVLIRAMSADDMDAWWDAVLDVLAKATLG